jgi:LysM repeat protein
VSQITPAPSVTPVTLVTSIRVLRRTAARAITGVAALAVAAGVTLVPATAEAVAGTPWPGHPDRTIVRHTVRPGETATALAVRYHAWTAELLRLNHLGSAGAIYQGQVLRIPVVLSAVRRAHGQVPTQTAPTTPIRKKHHQKKQHAKPVALLTHTQTPPGRGWLHADLTRDQVRALVTRMAEHYGVSRSLALAIAWQESGWQQRRISSAGAIGVMQVMPDTGRWMRWYAGRKLRLRDTHDNIEAGVLTLRVLRAWTVKDNNAIAAYYQGLGNVRKHGYFKDTKQYVKSVRGIQHRILHTGDPV